MAKNFTFISLRAIIFGLLLCSVWLFTAQNSSAQQYYQESLRIGDVRFSWSTYPGSIDTLVFEVKPKGLYTEIGMYFDFSTRGTSFFSGDSLEIQMLFKLPQDAEVTDMWLWIEDSIVKAGVYDRWTASQIYEEIVARRVDPAILYKWAYYDWNFEQLVYTDLYMFRIFPLMTDLPRKAKITYLIPNNDLASELSNISLPANIFQLSNLDIQAAKVRYFAGNNMGNPTIAENASLPFTIVNDPVNGIYYETGIPNLSDYSSLTLSLTNHNPGEIFAGTYSTSATQNFYELQVIPNHLFGLTRSKKVLLMFDYIDNLCVGLTGTQLINAIKTKLHNQLAPTDSFNIMISGMYTTSLSNTWIPADSLSIETTFSNFSASSFHSYSSLPALLMDGVTFVQENGNDGSIFLIASSNSNGAYQQANSLINNYIDIMGSQIIPIHIIDLDDQNFYNESQYIGGQYFYGNEYLYINLSLLTVGEYMSLQDQSLSAMLDNAFQKISGYLSSFDLYVTKEAGFTFSNYNISNNSSLVYYDQPYKRIGKHTGTGRFRVIASAQLPTGEMYQTEFIIEDSLVTPLDSIARVCWSANLIHEMLGYNQSNAVVSSIINTSITERVLCDYTAFLALEPGIGNLNGENGIVTELPSVKPETKPEVVLFPNPASESLSVNISLTENSGVVIELFDLTGKKISTLYHAEHEKGEQVITVSINDLSEGIYICRIKAGDHLLCIEKLTVVR